MRFGLTRKSFILSLSICLLVPISFTLGFVSSLHMKTSASSEFRKGYLTRPGDAPPPVRTEVIATLRAFQDGYIRRNPEELNSFMSRLFPKSDDVLVLGTDADEWVRGYTAVGEFIRNDWLKWGDFRFAVDDSIVWASGDVAWIASVGVVHGKMSDRPLRFSAILTRKGNSWVFSQVHFQWDDRDPRPSDLLQPRTQIKMLRRVLRYVTGTGRSATF